MRSEETSAGNATLLPPAPSSLLGRAKVLKSAKKVNRNGQSDVHHHRRVGFLSVDDGASPVR